MKLTALIFLILFSVVTSIGQIIPIVELGHRGLIGGVQNGKWITAEKVAPTMSKETEFILISFRGVEEGGISLGTKGEKEDVCQDFTRMEFDLKQEEGIAIGARAKW